MKADRHATVETVCEWCSIVFAARKERVEKGQSRFCSREHYREWKKQNPEISNLGKENAKPYLDKGGGFYRVMWIDPETMKQKSTTWARWAWEINFGEVPDDHRVSFRDDNPMNIAIENLCLKHVDEYVFIGNINRGVRKSESTRRKLSDAHSGKTLSDSHKVNIGNATRKKWANGDFDSIHKGEHNKYWRGGVPKPYPPEFYAIKDFIKERDNYTCQICGKSVYRSRHGHVHHINGNKNHNDEDNLILFCSTCHSKVHHGEGVSSPTIMAFRAMLEWNHNDIPENNLPNPLNFPEE